MTLRLLVLVSGAGTLLQALLDAQASGELAAEVVAVAADRTGIEGLARAARAGIPSVVVRLGDFKDAAGVVDRAGWDTALASACAQFTPDLVVSAGFMKVVGGPFLARFGGRMINTHPALLPSFPGPHGVRNALSHGVRVTGCTIFEVDAGVDTGRIIDQVAVRVEPGDTEESLHERIKIAERRLLVDTVNALAVAHNPSARAAHSRRSTMDRIAIRRALVSVYDKTGLAELGKALTGAGVEVVSTGGSYRLLSEAGLRVTEVAELTGFPECLDGRVKTLHPRVHAGILADRRLESHRAQLEELGVAPFDLVVSNLYPFTRTVTSGASVDECVEQIDIGGPSMVRAAAKNHPSVAIVTSPEQYDQLVAALGHGGFTLEERKALAAAAFVHTATYDTHVASWMGSVLTDSSGGTGFPGWVGGTYDRVGVLRYGENSHQPAALYRNGFGGGGLADAEQFGGKEMSYNNYTDTDAARRAAYDFDEPAVAIIKHANPCGIAVGADIAEAHRRAHECDPVSAFGGVIAANRPVTLAMAEQVKPVFTEVIVAPDYEPAALELLQTKKNLRILKVGAPATGGVETRPIDGGLLMQVKDQFQAPGDDAATWELKAGDPVDEATLADLVFAWRACRAVKSNAILLAAGGASVGVGMGQVNRVDSCKLAVERAGERAAESVAASDAFFPFADGPTILIEAGVKAIVEPGGSVRDEETIEACRAAGVALYFTGTRHFFH